MLRYANYGVVFSEIPDETTLSINISNCPIHCEGCHSKYLWKDEGEPLDYGSLSALLEKYGDNITCVCFMGGDSQPELINALAHMVHNNFPKLKVGWYSGRDYISPWVYPGNLDYLKLGDYQKNMGGLDNPNTNQKLYKVNGWDWEDVTHKLWKKKKS